MAKRNPELEKEALKLADLMGVDRDQLMESGLLELAELGFMEADTNEYPRMIVSSAAAEKCGKTHFSLHTTPSPVALIDFDIGTEGVINKKSDGRVIIHKQFSKRREAELAGEKLTQDDYEAEWNAFVTAYRAINNSPLIRTSVTDTGTEMYELCRLARFGKLEQVKPHHYGPVNREMRQLVQMPYGRKDLNAIFTHKIKKEYKDDKWKGGYERAGFGDMPFLVQVNIEHYKTTPDDEDESPEFGIRVINCRQNPDMDGEELIGKMCSFSTLGRMVFPESSKKDWE